MLPMDQAWYRQLLLWAVVAGLVAGVGALAYTGLTDLGATWFFDTEETGWFSGRWWWVPLIALGGLLAAVLRRAWSVPEKVAGAVPLVKQGWVDFRHAPQLVLVSVVSLFFGASLGPSFGLIMLGGGFASWLATRRGVAPEDARHEYALSGMAGGMGSVFSAPVFGSVLVTELSTTPKREVVTALVPQMIAATFGFVVFWGVTGSTIFGAYQLPSYEFAYADLLIAVGLGVVAPVFLLLFVLVTRLAARVAAAVRNSLVRGLLGGALVGLIAVALPLTVTSGSSQLGTVIDESATLGLGFLSVVLLAKMLAVGVSLSFGFLGGNVFPMVFIGGTAGVLVHLLIPDIPLSLSVAAMMAAVPGAFLDAPLSLTLIAWSTVGLGATSVAPITVAVLTSYVTLSAIREALARRRAAVSDDAPATDSSSAGPPQSDRPRPTDPP